MELKFRKLRKKLFLIFNLRVIAVMMHNNYLMKINKPILKELERNLHKAKDFSKNLKRVLLHKIILNSIMKVIRRTHEIFKDFHFQNLKNQNIFLMLKKMQKSLQAP